MSSSIVLDKRNCVRCDRLFLPKPGGHNAKYCSKHCKAANKYKREVARDGGTSVKQGFASSYYKNVITKDPLKMKNRREAGRSQNKKTRGWLAEYKISRGCVDCGYKQHFSALQLDHTSTKTAHISEIRSSIKRMQAEISSGKCEVRCANCHSVKTWATKNNLIYTPGMTEK